MNKHNIDLVISVIVLISGVGLLVFGDREYGGILITTSLGYISGAMRVQPGGLDDMYRQGNVEIVAGDENAEV